MEKMEIILCWLGFTLSYWLTWPSACSVCNADKHRKRGVAAVTTCWSAVWPFCVHFFFCYTFLISFSPGCYPRKVRKTISKWPSPITFTFAIIHIIQMIHINRAKWPPSVAIVAVMTILHLYYILLIYFPKSLLLNLKAKSYTIRVIRILTSIK